MQIAHEKHVDPIKFAKLQCPKCNKGLDCEEHPLVKKCSSEVFNEEKFDFNKMYFRKKCEWAFNFREVDSIHILEINSFYKYYYSCNA